MKTNELLKLNSNYNQDEKKTILSHLLQCSKGELLLKTDDISPKIVKKYQKLLQSDLPIAYLLNESYFLGNKFYVNKNCLIPRPETEVLVDDLNNYLNKYFKDNISICDIGSGSGVIGISLKLFNLNRFVTMVDISRKALKVSKKNVNNYHLDANLIHGDMLKRLTKKYDCLVSNPPYLYEDSKLIDSKVLQYEPHLALFGGLKYYEEILKNASKYLNDKSIIAFEIGHDEKEDINNLVKKYFPNAKIINKKDLNDFDRYIYIFNNLELK